jgi:hypothetical protein
MQVPGTALLVATLVAAAGAAAVTPVRAEAPLSDVAYMQAARCAGLAEGSGADARRISAMLDHQDGRMSYVVEKADELRSSANREARRASGYGKAEIQGELSGVCRAYLGGDLAQSASPDHTQAVR